MTESSWPSLASRSAYSRARTKRRLPTANTQTMSVRTPACHRVSRARTLGGGIGTTEKKSDAANRVQKLPFERVVELAAQPGDGHVDDVIERRGSGGHMPYVAGEHFARDRLASMAEEVLEDIELLRCHVEGASAARDFVRDEIHPQVLALEGNRLVRASAAAQQRA